MQLNMWKALTALNSENIYLWPYIREPRSRMFPWPSLRHGFYHPPAHPLPTRNLRVSRCASVTPKMKMNPLVSKKKKKKTWSESLEKNEREKKLHQMKHFMYRIEEDVGSFKISVYHFSLVAVKERQTLCGIKCDFHPNSPRERLNVRRPYTRLKNMCIE